MISMRTMLGAGMLLVLAAGGGHAGAMEEWNGCVLVPWEHNNGDSFLVRTAEGAEHRVRLYFVEALQSLPGIGPTLASRIVAHRPLADADDLRRVPGIGPTTIEAIRDRLVFEQRDAP